MRSFALDATWLRGPVAHTAGPLVLVLCEAPRCAQRTEPLHRLITAVMLKELAESRWIIPSGPRKNRAVQRVRRVAGRVVERERGCGVSRVCVVPRALLLE